MAQVVPNVKSYEKRDERPENRRVILQPPRHTWNFITSDAAMTGRTGSIAWHEMIASEAMGLEKFLEAFAAAQFDDEVIGQLKRSVGGFEVDRVRGADEIIVGPKRR